MLSSYRYAATGGAVPIVAKPVFDNTEVLSQLSPNNSPPVIGVPLADFTTTSPSKAELMAPDLPNQKDYSRVLSKEQTPVTNSKSSPNMQKKELSTKPAKSSANEKSASGSKIKPESSLLSKPDNFTIQIVAAHDERNVKSLIVKLPVSYPHHVVRSTRNGKPWFILVYGSFPNKQQAALVRDSLPVEIRKNTAPWVRKQGELFSR